MITAAALLATATAAASGPCDIFAKGGTPCVAAHSVVRSMYAAYNGRDPLLSKMQPVYAHAMFMAPKHPLTFKNSLVTTTSRNKMVFDCSWG